MQEKRVYHVRKAYKKILLIFLYFLTRMQLFSIFQMLWNFSIPKRDIVLCIFAHKHFICKFDSFIYRSTWIFIKIKNKFYSENYKNYISGFCVSFILQIKYFSFLCNGITYRQKEILQTIKVLWSVNVNTDSISYI